MCNSANNDTSTFVVEKVQNVIANTGNATG